MAIKLKLAKELTEKVKALFEKHKLEFSIEGEGAAKYIAAETADGKKIYTTAEQWAAGVPCFEDEAGTTPCPDGSYELSTGETIVVSGGNVSEIQPKKEEMTGEEMAQVMSALTGRIEELETANAAQATELASLKEKATADKTKIDALTSEVAKLSKQAVKSVKDQKAEPEKVEAKPTDGRELTMQEKVRMAREKTLKKVA